jgi:uncharacterized protein YjdB
MTASLGVPRERSCALHRVIRDVATVVIVTACSADGLIPLGPASIELSPSSLSFESLGEDRQLSAAVKDQNGNPRQATIAWTSADTRVASVSTSGKVTAVGPGTTTVTATAGAVNKLMTISVLQVPRTVDVTPGQASLPALGATATLVGVVKDARGNPIPDSRLSWSSSDATVASVDATGAVTAVGNGTATITASVQSGSGTSTVQVAQQPTQLTLSPTSLELFVQGPTGSLTATARDARGNTILPGPISWSSSNTVAATVAWSGALATVTGVSAGTAVITAALGGLSAAATVTVRQLTIPIRNDYVGSVFLDPGGTVQPGQSITINVAGATTVSVWDCGQTTQCIMDPYTLLPGKSYRVITDPKGPPANLTIVEQ